MMRWLPQPLPGLTGVVNGRQLGGYLTADGRRVKDNVLLRTGKMSGATEDDVQALAETYHVTQIVDFRSASEFTQDPDPELPGCVNTNLPVISEEELAGAMTAEDHGQYERDGKGYLQLLCHQ